MVQPVQKYTKLQDVDPILREILLKTDQSQAEKEHRKEMERLTAEYTQSAGN